jgi:nucleotide-binding universal stress UspA family protein
MYRRILVAIEHSSADRTIIDHVSQLATLTGAALLLVHVADGWAARNFDQLNLRESEEMKTDREYLERLRAELAAAGHQVSTHLAMGDPANELIRVAEEQSVDLIAILGATVDKVRHVVKIPVLLLRAQ